MAAAFLWKTAGAAGTFHNAEKIANVSREKKFDRLRSFTEKIIAIQNATHPGRPAVLPPDSPPEKTFLFRVAKARVRCHRHFFNGFEKLELTEVQILERRHARAQKLIAKTLRESDRKRRPRRRLIRVLRKKMMSLSPIMACIRWMGEPLVRFARIASLAASKVELHQAALTKKSARVTSFPLDDDNSPLLSWDTISFVMLTSRWHFSHRSERSNNLRS